MALATGGDFSGSQYPWPYPRSSQGRSRPGRGRSESSVRRSSSLGASGALPRPSRWPSSPSFRETSTPLWRSLKLRSEEHTSELQSHSDLHSFPTRRSSDLIIFAGSFRGVTQTIPLAIFAEFQRDFDAAVALSET